MAAAKHNIVVARGEDFSFKLTVSSAGAAVDLNGSTFKSEIRRGGGKPLVASFDSITLATQSGDTLGQVTVKITDVETKKLDGNTTYEWDLFRTDDNGDISRLIYGNVFVEDSITNV